MQIVMVLEEDDVVNGFGAVLCLCLEACAVLSVLLMLSVCGAERERRRRFHILGGVDFSVHC